MFTLERDMSFDSNLTFEEKLQKKISIPLSAVTTIKIINNIMLQRSLALLTKLSEVFHVNILIELPSTGVCPGFLFGGGA